MDRVSIGQALRLAIDGEFHSAKYYNMLARQSEDPAVAKLFEDLAEQEVAHAQEIEAIGGLLGSEVDATPPNLDVSSIETVRGIEGRSNITYGEALALAIEAEQNAARFYRLMSELTGTEVALVFTTLARTEDYHEQTLVGIRDEAPADSLTNTIDLRLDDLVTADGETNGRRSGEIG